MIFYMIKQRDKYHSFYDKISPLIRLSVPFERYNTFKIIESPGINWYAKMLRTLILPYHAYPLF